MGVSVCCCFGLDVAGGFGLVFMCVFCLFLFLWFFPSPDCFNKPYMIGEAQHGQSLFPEMFYTG